MSKNSQKLAEVFTVWTDEIEQRLDAVFYRPEIRALLQNLDKLKTFPLGDLILEMSGGATPKVTEDFYLEEGGIPFLRVQNITEEGINLEDVKYKEQIENYADYVMKYDTKQPTYEKIRNHINADRADGRRPSEP